MWKGIGWLLLMLAFAAPASAEPVTRALFVGIDHYLYSRGKVKDANFDDLNGAVSDVGRIKQALRVAYKLDLDQPQAGKCNSASGVSITLTDSCATRDAIIDALTGQIAASSPGDTVLFYFAGHGSGVADDTVQDQASGYNSTILPTDARQPGQPLRDIFDRDLRGFADVANARGVNLVTMFDSCNSGTGLRVSHHDKDGHVLKRRDVESTRSVPRMRLEGLPAPIVPRLDARGPGGGYRVSFGAARDDEQAREVPAGDRTDGVFTSALVQAIVASPERRSAISRPQYA